MKNRLLKLISIIFGVLVFIDGLLNLLRGNDPGFGVFLIVLSSIFFPITDRLLKRWFGFKIHYLIKILLGLFIIWASLAVGAINEGYYPEIF